MCGLIFLVCCNTSWLWLFEQLSNVFPVHLSHPLFPPAMSFAILPTFVIVLHYHSHPGGRGVESCCGLGLHFPDSNGPCLIVCTVFSETRRATWASHSHVVLVGKCFFLLLVIWASCRTDARLSSRLQHTRFSLRLTLRFCGFCMWGEVQASVCSFSCVCPVVQHCCQRLLLFSAASLASGRLFCWSICLTVLATAASLRVLKLGNLCSPMLPFRVVLVWDSTRPLNLHMDFGIIL